MLNASRVVPRFQIDFANVPARNLTCRDVFCRLHATKRLGGINNERIITRLKLARVVIPTNRR